MEMTKSDLKTKIDTEDAIRDETKRTVRLSLLLALPSFGTALGMIYQVLSGVAEPGLNFVFLIVGFWASLLVIICWVASLPVWDGTFKSTLNERRKKSIQIMLFLAVVGGVAFAQVMLPSAAMMAAFMKSMVILLCGFLFSLYGIDALQKIRARSVRTAMLA
jgi:hypothetical protein